MGEITTWFARAERAAPAVVEQSRKRLDEACPELRVVDALPLMTLAVNALRQIVYANRAFLAFLGDRPLEEVLGQRPGEVLGCVNASSGPGGCGTSRFCKYCGAARALLRGIDGTSAVEECRLLRTHHGEREALELRVWATPLAFAEERITLFTVLDMSDERRRVLLEQIFFHDVLNTAGAVRALAGFLHEPDLTPEKEAQIKTVLQDSARKLVAEIEGQRTLSLAESGSLQPQRRRVDLADLLERVVQEYEEQGASRGLAIDLLKIDEPIVVQTDAALLGRVIGNLLKNAIEASTQGDVVTVALCEDTDAVEVSIANPAVMSEEVRSQVFHRSFSTKGRDRGLGTWSVKLLTERYLGGNVSFTSAMGKGTTFRVRLPGSLREPP